VPRRPTDDHARAGRHVRRRRTRAAADADRRAAAYLAGVSTRRVFPDAAALAGLARVDEPLPEVGEDAAATLALLDATGSPATVASNGPRYFGFVVGAALPTAAPAERLLLAWDQNAQAWDNSPAAATLEVVAAGWVLDALNLPLESAVGFGTSATACNVSGREAARRTLPAPAGWDIDRDGRTGAPAVRAVVSETVHVSVTNALRVLGFGLGRLVVAPTAAQGRVDPARLPALDARTILCLQAGKVNTGEFDLFAELVPRAQARGTWVHVDGAFGLWARASRAAAPLVGQLAC